MVIFAKVAVFVLGWIRSSGLLRRFLGCRLRLAGSNRSAALTVGLLFFVVKETGFGFFQG